MNHRGPLCLTYESPEHYLGVDGRVEGRVKTAKI